MDSIPWWLKADSIEGWRIRKAELEAIAKGPLIVNRRRGKSISRDSLNSAWNRRAHARIDLEIHLARKPY